MLRDRIFSSGRRVITFRPPFVETPNNLTTYSFAGIDVGTKPCLVLVAFHCGAAGSRSLVSGTIGGSAASLHGNSEATFGGLAFMSRSFTPGGSITIAGTWDGAALRAGIGVWTIEGLASATPTASDFTNGGGDASRTRTVAIGPEGIGIFAGTRTDTGVVATSINIGTITENYDQESDGANQYVGGYTTNNGGASPICTMNPVSSMAGIAFR